MVFVYILSFILSDEIQT